MAERKVVQTELESKEYEMLASSAKSKGMTIKQAAKAAIVEWAVSSTSVADDPLARVKPFKFKVKVKADEIDKVLYT